MKKAYWIGGGILVAGTAALIYSKVASTINASKKLKFFLLWHGGINNMHIFLSTVKNLRLRLIGRTDMTRCSSAWATMATSHTMYAREESIPPTQS